MKIKTFLFSLLLLISFSNAFAGLFIEPMLGYGSADGEAKPTTEEAVFVKNYELAMSGPMYGLKAGGIIGPVKLGLDYRMFNGDLDIKAKTVLGTNIESKFDGDATLMSFLVGTNIPMASFWGSYYIDGQLEAKPKAGGSTSTYTGKGYSLGAAFSPVPVFSFNIEYTKVKFDEVEIEGVTTKLSGDTAFDISIIFVYLSAPISF